MSNEEIVSLIQSGNVNYFADLWEQIERLVRWKANRIISAIGSRAGAEFDDLYQSGYLAMVAAVNTYDPESGSFAGWFMLHLRTAFAEATGTRSQKQAKDPIHLASSLNCPLSDDSDADLLLAVIPDPIGEISLQNVEERIYQQQLHNALTAALEKLPDNERDVIQKKYLEGIPAEQIAVERGTTREVIRQNEKNGLRQLRHPANAKLLRPFYDFDYYGLSGLSAFKNTGMSVQERYLIHQEKCCQD